MNEDIPNTNFREMRRCLSFHPRSTKSSQCERFEGHPGDHVTVCYSGELKIYPSKWTDADVLYCEENYDSR